ncbi:hypothetical protein RJ640_013259 [Escallonia rubra]|uniref:Ubiquitin-like domain-containing protein n=1 Tax=Escallonia rubra TaxID=112253 RepID=A0AA88RC50_9ASTE|nr:hypothetical protein RJ640_013259 [Escallonia rubra]
MVQLRVKHGGDGGTEEEFLFDCQITSSVDEIADAVVEIANFQWEIRSIAFHLEPRLSPLLHTDLQPKVMPLMKALSEAKSYVSKFSWISSFEVFSYDHSYGLHRTYTFVSWWNGYWSCSLDRVHGLIGWFIGTLGVVGCGYSSMQGSVSLEHVLNCHFFPPGYVYGPGKDQVQHNKPLSVYVLRDQVNSIGREFSVHYHAMNFPDSNLQQLRTGLEHLDKGTTQLWWAGKELTRGKKLCDYIGKNERTKIILRLQSPCSHPASNSVKEHFCQSKY